MRSRRMAFIFLAFYVVFIGGSAYYNLLYPVRFFHHAFMTVLMAMWFWRRFRRDGLPVTPLNRPIFAVILMWAVNAFTSIDTRMAIENLWFMFLHVTLLFFLVDIFQRGRQRLLFDTQFILAALIVVITGLELASWYFGLGFVPGTDIGWIDMVSKGIVFPLEIPRVSLAMNFSTLLAGYTAPLITLAIGWALTARQRDFRQALWVLTGGLTLVLLLTFSRGGLLSLGAAVGSLFMMRSAQEQRITRLISPRIIIGAAVGVGLLFVFLFSFRESQDKGDLVRVDMYRSAVEMAQDYPVTGVGTGIYGRAYREYRDSGALTRDRLASAHNLYLNILAENGLVGVLAWGWAVVAMIRAWWITWQNQTTWQRKLRLEACIAALIGVGFHSLVDVFTVTPIISLLVLLIAYSITGHRTVLDERPTGPKWAAGIGLLITLGYGLFFIQTDRAYMTYLRSFDGEADQLALAREAESIDPHLNLYDLHIAHLLGERANQSEDTLTEAITAYEKALELEPTWDTGWINLAALEIHRENYTAATEYLLRASEINPITTVAIPLAETAEIGHTLSGKEIIYYYRSGMYWALENEDQMPLSDYWMATPLRRAAVKTYLAHVEPRNADRYYRIAAGHFLYLAEAMVNDNPQSAVDYWIAGEHALTVESNPEKAVDMFSEAIERDPSRGDFYVSRARARYTFDPEAAITDIRLARLLGTRFEYPFALLAQMEQDSPIRNDYLARSVPTRAVKQEMAAVLYGGRAAGFDLLPEMRPPGPGREILQPWYTLAEQHAINGRIEQAINVYEAIIEVARYETEAPQHLAELKSG